jgi:hypothetical protein
MPSTRILRASALASALAIGRGLDNGFRLPVLGFNSWNVRREG